MEMRAVFWTLAGLLACASASYDKKIVCYFGSWAIYRPGNGQFDVSNIDPNLCTHLIYAFVGLSDKGAIRLLDPEVDLSTGKDGFNRFNQLRRQNPSLKTLVGVGGWNEGSVNYSNAVASAESRVALADNAVRFVRGYGFDGLDMDWEYPSQRGGVPADRENFVLLMKELRERFDREGLLLSAAVAAAEVSASLSYLIPEVSKYLHFVNLMTYDLHGPWDKKTGINAPLYPGSWEQGAERNLNVEACVDYWITQGAPREKLIVGMPFYGKSFTLDNPQNKRIGAPASSPGTAGPYTQEAGTLSYNEICVAQKTNVWKVYFEPEQRVPYAVLGDQWVGYDNPRSLEEKADFVERLGLGGAMVWSLESDDFRGLCGEKYPLLKTLNHVLRGGPPLANTTPGPTYPPSPPPTTAQGVFQCTEAGYFRDYYNCSVFYICVADPQLGYRKYRFDCPSGLYFDTTVSVCNCPYNVQCTNYV